MPVAFVSLRSVSESIHQDLSGKLDSISQSLPPLLVSLASFCGVMWPYVLPPILSILLEAPLSLQTWIAVQKMPFPARSHPCARRSRLCCLRKHALAHLAPIYFLSASLVASYLQCIVGLSVDRMRIFEAATLGPLIWFGTFRLFGLLSKMYTLSIRRNADGDPRLIRTLRPSVPRMLQVVPLALSLIVTYRAIHFDDSICMAIAHVALLHVFVSLDARSRESIKVACVYALTDIATLVALTMFLAVQAKKIESLLKSHPIPVAQDPNHDAITGNIVSSRIESTFVYDDYEGIAEDPLANDYRWPLFALAVLWNIFPVELITLCYRFDYTRFVRLQGWSLSSLPLSSSEIGDDRSAKGDAISNGRDYGPLLTHDLLFETLPSSQTKARGNGENVSDAGPIFLAPEAPDSLYSRLPFPPYSPPHSPNPDEDEVQVEGTPLLTSLTLPLRPPSPTPSLPEHYIHTWIRTRIPFPAFLTSFAAYLVSTIFLALAIYFTAQSRNVNHGHAADATHALRCLVPLLPLVTLPITTFALPIGLAFFSAGLHIREANGASGDEECAVKDLWRYEENWRGSSNSGSNSNSGSFFEVKSVEGGSVRNKDGSPVSCLAVSPLA